MGYRKRIDKNAPAVTGVYAQRGTFAEVVGIAANRTRRTTTASDSVSTERTGVDLAPCRIIVFFTLFRDRHVTWPLQVM